MISGNSYAGLAYFEFLETWVSYCTGSASTNNLAHAQVRYEPYPRISYTLNEDTFELAGGQVKQWFSRLLAINRPPNVQGGTCWRTHEGKPLCDGLHSEIRPLVFSVPILFILDISSSRIAETMEQEWDFPASLFPGSQREAREHGVQYDLVGFSLYNSRSKHYNALYSSFDKTGIYLYDGMTHGGKSQKLNADKLSGIAAYSLLPSNYHICGAVYVLTGGISAQKYFFSKQTGAAGRLHHLQFEGTFPEHIPHVSIDDKNLEVFPRAQRLWMNNPLRSKEEEYIAIGGPRNDNGSDAEMKDVSAELEPLDDMASGAQAGSPSNVAVPFPGTSIQLSQQSDFTFSCRCGFQGDGNNQLEVTDPVMRDLEAVVCERCSEWSHIACQANGRIQSDTATRFFCDTCLMIGPAFGPGSQSHKYTNFFKTSW